MDARLTMDREAEGNYVTIDTPARAAVVEERLPFTIRVVMNESQLQKAISIRHRAYGRHVPALGEMLRTPEPSDSERGCAVLLAESKLDGEPLGTMRIQTNRYRGLALESSVELPDWLAQRSLAEATRLAVSEARIGRVVKTMLFKAFYLYCIENGIDWMVIGARSPLDRMYESLLFKDLYPELGYVPLRHAGNIPHRILALDIAAADAQWRAAKHPMYGLFVNTRHPDIDIGDTSPVFDLLARCAPIEAALAA